MSHHKTPQAVLWVQTIGCAAIILLSWVDEWAQLPGILFFGPRQVPNWREAAMETLVVVVAWAVMQLISRRLVRRLRYLEEFLRVCAWCRKIHLEDRWVPLEEYAAKGLGATTTHGICPACAEAQMSEYRRRRGAGASPHA